MSNETEFIRDKPKKKFGFSFSILHKLVPIIIACCGFWFSAQYFARAVGYHASICGAPWFIVNGNQPYYHPFLVILMIARYWHTLNRQIGNVLFTSSVIMFLPIFTALILYYVMSLLRDHFDKPDKVHGSSRWATIKDLLEYGLLEKSGGVVLGQTYDAKVDYTMANGSVKLDVKKPGQLVQHAGETSTMFFAPSRTGKGINSVIPTLFQYPHSLITLDPKGENYNITSGFRRKFSFVWRFAPCNKGVTLRFNPLLEITEENAFSDMNMLAQIIVTPAEGHVGEQKHWIDAAQNLITTCGLHVLCSDFADKTLHGILAFITESNKSADRGKAMCESMINAQHVNAEIHTHIVHGACIEMARADEERASVFSTALTALQLFEDPKVAYATSASDFKLDYFRKTEKPISLYLTVPFAQLDRLAPLMRIIITFILRKFSEGETQFGDIKLKQPILFLIDEFATLGALPILETMMGILNGYGIRFFLICQSYSQILKLYTDKSPILEHCRYLVTFANSDINTAEMFSKMIGVTSYDVYNKSVSGNKFNMAMDNLNISSQQTQLNLMNADEIQHLAANLALIFTQGGCCYIAKKIAYYSDKRFKDKANLPTYENASSMMQEVQPFNDADTDEPWYYLPASTFLPTGDESVFPVLSEQKSYTEKDLHDLNQREAMARI